MITLSKDTRIFIHHSHVDMRKSIDGLVFIVVDSMQLDPQEKSLYLFRNKSCDKIKAIIWDGDGFILLYKRKEKGRFHFPKNITEPYYEIDSDLLVWLLKGFDFYRMKYPQELKISQYF